MKLFLVVVMVLIGAVAVGWYVTPKPSFIIEESTSEPEISTEPVEISTPLENGVYLLVAEDSRMTWRGRRPLIEGYMDNGTIELSAGEVVVSSGSLSSGSITADVTTITAESTGRDQGETLLSRHLKSADWFDAETYPTIVFEMIAVNVVGDDVIELSGELTIKDISHPVTFPVILQQNEDTIIITASEIELDRTKWGVNYQSGSFFGDLGEELIDDIFLVSFTASFTEKMPELIEGSSL